MKKVRKDKPMPDKPVDRDATSEAGRGSAISTWDRQTCFVRCADLILDTMEQAFDIVAPRGRASCQRAIIDMLDYYCIPKDGPDGSSIIEQKMRRERPLCTATTQHGQKCRNYAVASSQFCGRHAPLSNSSNSHEAEPANGQQGGK